MVRGSAERQTGSWAAAGPLEVAHQDVPVEQHHRQRHHRSRLHPPRSPPGNVASNHRHVTDLSPPCLSSRPKRIDPPGSNDGPLRLLSTSDGPFRFGQPLPFDIAIEAQKSGHRLLLDVHPALNRWERQLLLLPGALRLDPQGPGRLGADLPGQPITVQEDHRGLPKQRHPLEAMPRSHEAAFYPADPVPIDGEHVLGSLEPGEEISSRHETSGSHDHAFGARHRTIAGGIGGPRSRDVPRGSLCVACVRRFRLRRWRPGLSPSGAQQVLAAQRRDILITHQRPPLVLPRLPAGAVRL